MITKIERLTESKTNHNRVIIAKDAEALYTAVLSQSEKDYIKSQFQDKQINSFDFDRLGHWLFVRILKDENEQAKTLENMRKSGNELQAQLNKMKQNSVLIDGSGLSSDFVLAFAEGMALGNYQFIKYFSDKAEKSNTLQSIYVNEDIDEEAVAELNIVVRAVCYARDLVNEPVMQLNAHAMSERFKEMAAEAGIKIEVLNKKKIESLKMGGLLSVNAGSVDPPTFTIMEWKPRNAKNEKPLVLVGKGVTYDTGGLNIKTGKYMETMKSDMSGAAMMASVIYAAAQAKLPLHIIALIPATDNRLNGNAYASGDVIKMHNGLTVEIINTDAEGRMILADALSYAQKYDPELVIDAATLTGSAQRAIGKYGVAAMHTQAGEAMVDLKKSGDAVYERVAEFPFWDEYAELMKSDIADLKNSGPAEAGMITAGKFLQRFTNYPFIHLDIAGVAFAEKRDSYRNLGGTGFGVRLLFDFLKKQG